METGAITSHIDVAQVALYAFWIFFAYLLYYLRREDRREGYPLLSEVTGQPESHGAVWIPEPKRFKLESGRIVEAPKPETDTRDFALAPNEPWPGAPFVPTGNPMTDGVGPGAYALRPDIADVTFKGQPRIVPMRVDATYHASPDPRGFDVIGADFEMAGKIVDAWVDRSDQILRYYEVELSLAGAGGRHVLLPVNFADVKSSLQRVLVDAIHADQFANVPPTKSPDQITLLEEEKISAYFGAGCLYANPMRQEPLL